jgi:hypothetical protein
MATAVGQYATKDGVKARMQMAGMTFGAQDDAILTTICAQVNGWVESRTGRPLVPYPLVSTTTSAAAAAGAQTLQLAAVAGVSVGDAVMVGPVAGVHEHGVVAGIAGNAVTLQWPLAGAYASGSPVVECLLFDGSDALEDDYGARRIIQTPNGIVSATTLEVAFYTGGAFNLIPPQDWFLRPLPLDREPGWPAFEIHMTDIPSSGNPCPVFNNGMGNIRVGGVQPGWPAMPDEVVGLAEKLSVGTYRARTTGTGQVTSVDASGTKVIESLMSAQDWRLLSNYCSKEALVI